MTLEHVANLRFPKATRNALDAGAFVCSTTVNTLTEGALDLQHLQRARRLHAGIQSGTINPLDPAVVRYLAVYDLTYPEAVPDLAFKKPSE